MLATSGLTDMDRRFVTELVYGTTRMRRACDSVIDRFVTSPPDDATRSVLRLGAYQLVFAGVPPHAAVGETVGLAPKRTRGFVNAVLRKVSRLSIDEMSWPSDGARLSYPDWMVDLFRAELGADDATLALQRMNEPPPVTTRDDGYVQDASSQWVAAAVEVEFGARVLDVCAAPGGKATAMAAAGARVIAADQRLGSGPPRPGECNEARPRPAGRRRGRCRCAVPTRFVRRGSARRPVLGARCAASSGRRPLADPAERHHRAGRAAGAAARVGRRTRGAGRSARLQRVHDHRSGVRRPSHPCGVRGGFDAAVDRYVATVRAGLARAATRRRHRRAWC